MAKCDSLREGGQPWQKRGFRAFAGARLPLDRLNICKARRALGDWGFWIAAGGMALAVAASLIAALFQKPQVDLAVAAPDVQVYRAQLAEVERDVAAGRLAAPEADRLRVEIARRILEADRAGRGSSRAATTAVGGRWATALAVLVVLCGAVWGYARLGAPGYPDLPLSSRIAAAEAYHTSRPSQAIAEAAAPKIESLVPDAELAALLDKLRQAVAARPGDVEGLTLLVRNEAALGNLAAARDAQVALIAAKPVALGQDHAELAELMIGLTGGYVSPEAEAELIAALELEPANGTALYYSGLMFAQGDRADRAFAIWRGLLETSAPDAPWIAPIRAGIADLAARAGVDYALPDASGPTAADVDAAAEMTAEDRRAMIETMVEGLSDRLAKDGGPAADWARLITSLGVLGDLARASAIYAEAQGRFVGRAGDLEMLRVAANAAGIVP